MRLSSLLIALIILCLVLALGAALFDRVAREIAGALGPSYDSRMSASAVCVGALNLGSCNVRQTSTQTTSRTDGEGPWMAILLVLLFCLVIGLALLTFGG